MSKTFTLLYNSHKSCEVPIVDEWKTVGDAIDDLSAGFCNHTGFKMRLSRESNSDLELTTPLSQALKDGGNTLFLFMKRKEEPKPEPSPIEWTIIRCFGSLEHYKRIMEKAKPLGEEEQKEFTKRMEEELCCI